MPGIATKEHKVRKGELAGAYPKRGTATGKVETPERAGAGFVSFRIPGRTPLEPLYELIANDFLSERRRMVTPKVAVLLVSLVATR